MCGGGGGGECDICGRSGVAAIVKTVVACKLQGGGGGVECVRDV